MTAVNWTEDKSSTLKRMWLAGEPTDEIRRALGYNRKPMSYSAVMRQVGRLNLPKRTSEANAVQTALAGKAAVGGIIGVKPTKIRFEPQAGDVVRIYSTEALANHHCRWPIGDPRKAGFGYCGAHTDDVVGYCAEHTTRAYNPGAAPIKYDRRVA